LPRRWLFAERLAVTGIVVVIVKAFRQREAEKI
jgi:hypothetical protein